MWHANGYKSVDGNYKKGKKNGLWSSWYKNSQKKYAINYNDGKRDGKVTLWRFDGKLDSKAIYKDGFCMREQHGTFAFLKNAFHAIFPRINDC